MRTRSSRFFVILLHLVGVSQHRYDFIVGVHPWPIILEEVYGEISANEPVWLQDNDDGACLGPTSASFVEFVECGDATQWFVSQKIKPLFRMGLFGLESDLSELVGWTFSTTPTLRKRSKMECLVADENSIQIQRKCRGKIASWERRGNALRSSEGDCLWRNEKRVRLGPCSPSNQQRSDGYQKVNLSMVRYRPLIQQSGSPTGSPAPSLTHNEQSNLQIQQPPSIPYSRDLAHQNAIPTASKQRFNNNPAQKVLRHSNPLLLFPTTTNGIPDNTKMEQQQQHTHLRPSKIVIHPYIAAAQNNIWKDPQTGLEYPTDLSHYLGKQMLGRHTLMGVGQYIKGYVIKVYGIALYVSKRDVLSDSSLVPYADMTADELRLRPDFYELLQHRPVDKTLLLKTNMQLSTETMRSSLGADWKMLTDEAKRILVDSSMRSRPAEADMLQIVNSQDNPSRCSCSQVAPPEYNADSTCCARGTELAFTWLKNGQLEIRLNGRVVDTFERPDIAEGIFYEYLRYDDPISPDLRERLVDGFPFLLAPLAQVRGLHMASSHKSLGSEDHPIIQAISHFTETIVSGVMSVPGLVQRTAIDSFVHVGNAVKSAGTSAHNTGSNILKDVDRQRRIMWTRMVSFPDFVLHVLSRDRDPMEAVTEWVNMTPDTEELKRMRKESMGRAFGYPLSHWFSETYQAPDEIGPMKIHPTMNTTRRIFLALVHLYLLLLFIVSFPGSYATRTKVIVRKNLIQDQLSDSDSDSSEDDCLTGVSKVNDHQHASSRGNRLPRSTCQGLGPSASEETPTVSKNGTSLKQKSFSYFL